ncbi:MAG: hypothetical protein IKJ40_06850, partial [Bacteroidales bacterium]|nr:hypothetical protein [Bacteroidales bacterium]
GREGRPRVWRFLHEISLFDAMDKFDVIGKFSNGHIHRYGQKQRDTPDGVSLWMEIVVMVRVTTRCRQALPWGRML